MVCTVVRMILFLSEDRNGFIVTVDKRCIIIIITQKHGEAPYFESYLTFLMVL